MYFKIRIDSFQSTIHKCKTETLHICVIYFSDFLSKVFLIWFMAIRFFSKKRLSPHPVVLLLI